MRTEFSVRSNQAASRRVGIRRSIRSGRVAVVHPHLRGAPEEVNSGAQWNASALAIEAAAIDSSRLVYNINQGVRYQPSLATKPVQGLWAVGVGSALILAAKQVLMLHRLAPWYAHLFLCSDRQQSNGLPRVEQCNHCHAGCASGSAGGHQPSNRVGCRPLLCSNHR